MNNTHNSQTVDRNLIETAANGDAAAFRAVVEQHQAMVYRTCLRILRNEADAQDAAQATFVVFYKKCSQLKPEIVLGGWLYRTAELVCREYIRSSRRRKRREEETAVINEAMVQDNTQIWSALQPELDMAMMTLPQKYRDVVVLRYLEGKSTTETAAAMGLADSAVTTRLARAMEKLRTWFHRRGVVVGAGVLPIVMAEHATAATVPGTLAPSALAAVGTGAVSASANTSLMAKGALAKMGYIAWHLHDAVISVFWICSMISWVRGGCAIPRWVHSLAIGLFGAGLVSVFIVGAMGFLTATIAATCILAPPAAAYVGWLWMFGPEHAKSSSTKSVRDKQFIA